MNVLYPGRRNKTAGPDFRDCILTTESGEVVVGDVEVHVTLAEWSAHRHDVDPNYNGVVLHVVLRPKGGAATQLQSKATVRVAALEPIAEALQADATHERLFWRQTSVRDIQETLDEAGDAWFLSKAAGYDIEIEDGDPEQVLYAVILEALGYSANRKPFVSLARALPIARLRALRGEPRATRLLAIGAMLLSSAGLMPDVSVKESETLQGVLRHPPATRKIKDPWKKFRERPSNHPIRRVEGAARLIDRSMDEGLIGWLKETIRAGDHRTLTRSLEVQPHWDSQSEGRCRKRRSPSHVRVGRNRTRRRTTCEQPQPVQKFPSLAENEITREMKRLLPEGVDTRGARRRQGLIHLYKNMRAQWRTEQKSQT